MKQHKQRYERYLFKDSPWVQDLTQRDLAELLGWKKHQLEALIRDKERWVKREPKQIGLKLRNLAVPTGKLRTIHERLKFHLNKIRQPEYLFSPRKGRSQRDNAEHHAQQTQFLSLDIQQFYPSTTDEHIFRWAFHVAGLRSDVAGLFTKLVAIDRKMPFGSPVSPVLITHIHRAMFDEIFAICQANGLRMSLWVDDLTISGTFVRGELVEQIRGIIRQRGFQTHKIEFRSAARRVIVTGVPIERRRVMAPRALHQRIQNGYAALRGDLTDVERGKAIDKLLSALGTYRYHLGPSEPGGRKAADRMEALRVRRAKLDMTMVTLPAVENVITASSTLPGSELPWE
ncbi:reverse transcriptase family protein [Sphingomonas sanguinis]|uniref:reverse transcriptase family protein n=1 Tax=Sphingomonas sanguinis TaxID=33051 RepID=UPI0009E98C15|nr:reverse transcriptase family protein [Sphingomonas sanguinis]